MEIQNTPFIRELASSDRRIRDKALESLTQFLRSRRDLEFVELLKVWKGLFFCYYHSDRPLTQQSLARALSYSLLPTLPEPMLQSFLRAFWLTMSRDFNALDRHRLDKYLYLIRCYVGASFDILLQKGFKKGASRGEQNRESTGGSNKSNPKKRKREELEEKAAGDVDAAWSDLEIYIAMLEEGPLCPYNFDPEEGARKTESTMPKGPDGIRYHLLDIWIDELEKFATEPKQSDDGEETATAATTTLKPGVPMELILRPIMRLKRESPNKTARKLAAGVWEDERLVAWGVMEPKETDKDEDDEWGGFD